MWLHCDAVGLRPLESMHALCGAVEGGTSLVKLLSTENMASSLVCGRVMMDTLAPSRKMRTLRALHRIERVAHQKKASFVYVRFLWSSGTIRRINVPSKVPVGRERAVSLQSEDGEAAEHGSGVKKAVVRYFSNLLRSGNWPNIVWYVKHIVRWCIRVCVWYEMDDVQCSSSPG